MRDLHDHYGHPDAPIPEGAETRPRGARAMTVVLWLLVVAAALAALFSFGALSS